MSRKHHESAVLRAVTDTRSVLFCFPVFRLGRQSRRSLPHKQLAILPLAVVTEEVAPAGRLVGQMLCRVLLGGNTGQLVGVALGLAANVSLDDVVGLLDITGDIERVAGGLGNGQSVVEGNAAGDGTEADQDAPHLVDGDSADSGAVGRLARR